MSLPKHRTAPAAPGFSLVEMMVALVAGMVVVGAVLAFTISSVRANSDFVKSTRLMQQLRTTSDYITSELKRAGYDESAMKYVANPSSTAASKFAPILVDTSVGKNCVVYAYDRQPGTSGEIDLGNGEIRAIRRATAALDGQNIGVIEIAESFGSTQPTCNGAGPDYTSYPTVCNAVSGWCPLTDPRMVNIGSFTVGTGASGSTSHGVQTISAATGLNAMQLREFAVTVTGALRSDSSATRAVQTNIKVRADCVRASVNPACTTEPKP